MRLSSGTDKVTYMGEVDRWIFFSLIIFTIEFHCTGYLRSSKRAFHWNTISHFFISGNYEAHDFVLQGCCWGIPANSTVKHIEKFWILWISDLYNYKSKSTQMSNYWTVSLILCTNRWYLLSWFSLMLMIFYLLACSFVHYIWILFCYVIYVTKNT